MMIYVWYHLNHVPSKQQCLLYCSIVIHRPSSSEMLCRGRNFSNFTEDSKRVHLKSPHRRFPRPFRTPSKNRSLKQKLTTSWDVVRWWFQEICRNKLFFLVLKMRYTEILRDYARKIIETLDFFLLGIAWIEASVWGNEDCAWSSCRILTGKRVRDPAQQQANTQFWASPSNLL